MGVCGLDGSLFGQAGTCDKRCSADVAVCFDRFKGGRGEEWAIVIVFVQDMNR